MYFKLRKKEVKKNDKVYVNFYLEFPSGRLVPINVSIIKDKEGNIKNKYDFIMLCNVADYFDKE